MVMVMAVVMMVPIVVIMIVAVMVVVGGGCGDCGGHDRVIMLVVMVLGSEVVCGCRVPSQW